MNGGSGGQNGAAEPAGWPAPAAVAASDSPLTPLVASITSQLEATLGRADQVTADCQRLTAALRDSPADRRPILLSLAGSIAGRSREMVEPVVALLEEWTPRVEDPAPIARAMLAARSVEHVGRAVELMARLAAARTLDFDEPLADELARRIESDENLAADEELLRPLQRLFDHLRPTDGAESDPRLSLFLRKESGELRRLAARLLDFGGQVPTTAIAQRLLGERAHAFLRPYLEYTRATHFDLLTIACGPDGSAPVLPYLEEAQELCGLALLGEVIAELGWSRLNHGLEVERLLGVSLNGSFPFMLREVEGALLERLPGARRQSDLFLFRASGAPPAGDEDDSGAAGEIARFRRYNLAHAEILGQFLNVAPVTHDKVRWMLDHMAGIVDDFVALFHEHAAECAILPDIFRGLRERIETELAGEEGGGPLSTELTRLAQAFEDPAAAGDVRTLHGLKRFLHQRGLKLGFRLFQRGGAASRTVDLLLASPRKVLATARKIRYADFEPAEAGHDAASLVPYPVRVVAEAFALHLFHGQTSLPDVQVFCYGNEVHYYLTWLNHPAFLRIDYAPPLSGGMIDLEYYGVSKYQIASHPSPELDAIRQLFRRLEFDVQIDQTHIHARYDKERALDLADLIDRTEMLFRLVPVLMDLDWTIGSLALDAGARARVRDSWIGFFADWGLLPFDQFLTRDRQGLLVRMESGPAGPREVAWTGVGLCPARYPTPTGAELLAQLQARPEAVPLRALIATPWDDQPLGQVALERRLLRPLRQALRRGEIVSGPVGLTTAPAELFRREDDAAALARLLVAGGEPLLGGMRIARVIAPLERTIRFRDCGAINGCRVQQARLALRGGLLGLSVLRDPVGMIRLGLFAEGDRLFRRRESADAGWTGNGDTDAGRLLGLLRASSYQVPGMDPTSEGDEAAAQALQETFRRVRGPAPPPPLPGERIVGGHTASPGRAVGPAIFGTDRRRPEECDNAILVAPTLRPEDNAWLFHAAGVVSTGGGILSHVGLIAAQFRKPALIIPGRWVKDETGRPSLHFFSQEYREETETMDGFQVAVWRDVRESEQCLREGDLVVLDAESGTLTALGQEADALALHRSLNALSDIGQRLGVALDPVEVLALRGRRLQLRFQVEKILGRLVDPVAARHVAHELLVGGGGGGTGEGRVRLLSVLLGNRLVSATVRRELTVTTAELERRLEETVRRVEGSLGGAGGLYALLAPRLDALHLLQSLRSAGALLEGLGFEAPAPPASLGPLDRRILAALEELRSAGSLRVSTDPVRHQLRQLGRLDALLGRGESPDLRGAGEQLARSDNAARLRLAGRRILGPEEGGLELYPLIGWKAAHLAELERLGARGAVPPWFAITDAAFNEVMDSPLHPAPGPAAPEPAVLRSAIEGVLARRDLDAGQKSEAIGQLWSRVNLPPGLAAEVIDGYRRLASASPPEEGALPFVAVRSSSLEEDAEVAARAGEFMTFLFVQGEERLLEHLRRAWSGLWTERAIHNRGVLGLTPERVGGGILVQRIVHSRVAGVLLTANVAEREPMEMVINAGLGLGEGIVSGLVAADHVLVAREGDLERGPLRFHYVTADKQEQIVYNQKTGLGTARVETRYHQRLRPALEYVELCELVRMAAMLERAYGYPLDIEYALEGSRLWLLQARPVASFLAVLRETLEEHPLTPEAGAAAPVPH